ncbi:DUF3040 domain-containing protein [Umezawaea sp. NPDC059074]|uniref:DUF3040 domain-containing protein n=1 Tax=Umezawaea sp. NPDC059074 TaxID=3346716 RepID=UPI0036B27947
MELGDRERRQFEAIEQGLVDGDPKFAAKMRRLDSEAPRMVRLLRDVLVLLATYVIGLSTIVAGVWLSSIVLVVFGAVVTAGLPVLVGWRAYRDYRVKNVVVAAPRGQSPVR